MAQKRRYLQKKQASKLGEITRILMFIEREGVVERKRERFTYWRVTVTIDTTLEIKYDDGDDEKVH